MVLGVKNYDARRHKLEILRNGAVSLAGRIDLARAEAVSASLAKLLVSSQRAWV